MGFLSKLFGKTEQQDEAPQLSMQALPISINVGPNTPQAIARHAGRLASLMRCIADGDTRPEVADEIEKRKAALTLHGHTPPATAEEAEALAEKMGG